MKVLLAGIDVLVPELDSHEEAAQNCAEAIMTTDTVAKSTAVEIDINGIPVRIAGICKGSGMIHPRMATLLCYITTDIDISKPLLDKAFRESIGKSFNRITIDGDMSTNDTVVILANGLAKNEKIISENEYYHRFKEALEYVCIDLAKKIVSDGEGATKLIQIDVRHAKSDKDAHLIFEAVATSILVKTAFFGEDANWGRIIAAMGISGASFDMQRMTLTFRNHLGEILLFKDGIPAHFDGAFAKEILKEKAIEVIIDLHDGMVDITGWTCDLSYDYIKINASYRS
jgi:glutamate N-acetyltransferase/amino-acid N-acetyltransferase